MRWKRVLSECLLVTLAIAISTLPHSASAPLQQGIKPAFDASECETVLTCHACSLAEQQDVRECQASGKIVTLSCPLLDVDENASPGAGPGAEEDDTVTRYTICHRTAADEHSSFVRFQLFCLCVGIFSFVWVRRYRVIYASLFEQRKLSRISRRPSDGDLELGGGNANSGDNSPTTIELALREEMAPLNQSNLEII